ncbi:hypothetical protein PVBG_06079 [Plasmodium vivax Brazil I]|uniref:PIR Superfamily Protein n=1 Tax=Plasmodium vivax (strain Brazil I) TaxID=1033975 RepID=A0A0J9T250_PLAV1|nr:hypothetical protein PVBG_06079 [Plasmodium vivax Brazil I]
MECNTSKEVDSYDFFKNIENYLDKANKAELSTSADGGFSDCVRFSETYSSSFKDKLIAKSVCEEIIKLYKSLHQFNSKSSCSNHKNDCDFFNYWVNYKISKSIINDSDCVERIYNYFESQCLNDFGIPLDDKYLGLKTGI